MLFEVLGVPLGFSTSGTLSQMFGEGEKIFSQMLFLLVGVPLASGTKGPSGTPSGTAFLLGVIGFVAILYHLYHLKCINYAHANGMTQVSFPQYRVQ